MKVAITGAGGLVGRHLAARFAAKDEVLALGHADLDITDLSAVLKWAETERPQLIVNCAVMGVDECERDELAARALNVDGPRTLAEAAARLDAEFVHFSSNYVFGGEEEGREPYTLKDEPRPVNVYGRTKLAGSKAAGASPRPDCAM
ncbi:MAG: sugar nucleotide-binding protein [Acidobacteria bacterium]|nr:sugar nucleotide-binding protein [Acidobacteriota bacterium]